MFPVHNISGRVVAFGGRTLRTEQVGCEVSELPESEIYSKETRAVRPVFRQESDPAV